MMMGPAPMIRIEPRSARLGTSGAPRLHHLHELVEQIAEIVRTGARLRVSLEAECRAIGTRQSLQAAVEERDMGDAHVLRQRRAIHGKAMVLAGNDDLSGVLVEHRMVRAVV